FTARLIKYLIAHGRHIESYLSLYYSPNTHLTGEALGLFYLGASLPELRRSRAWRETGLRILLEQLPLQVREDGVYFEQTSYYHRYTTDFYTHLWVLAHAGGLELPGGAGDRLRLLFEHLMWITRPDGSSPLFGDDDGGRLITLGHRAPNDFRGTLAAGAALFRRADWKFVAGDAGADLLWLLGPEGLADYDRLAAQPPSEKARAFATSGYFVMRDGWSRDSSYLLIDCGPHGAPIGCGHAHADALAIEFAAGGHLWLVDPGTFVYDADLKRRDDFRSTSAHNTVTVDGRSQSVPAGPFSWNQIAECRLGEFSFEERAGSVAGYFEGRHHGYQRLNDPVTHTRAVLFVAAEPQHSRPAFLVVYDTFSARDQHQYVINFHLPAACRAAANGAHAQVIEPGGGVLTMAGLAKGELRAQVREGWVSTCYAQSAAAPVVVFEAEGTGPQEFVTLIYPDQPTRMVELEQLLMRHLQAGDLQQLFKFLLSGKGDSTGEMTR
ncbi:MAG TPA: alginate lyase family protein, partial [Blastocatellia bacterium]|nr:alginate lyase family protein [Blastocatellia bacterium]